ncbi:MAG: MFS transporter [Halolamina sp.]
MLSEDTRQQLLIGVAAAARFASGILLGTGLAFYLGRNDASALVVGLVTTAYFLGMTVFSPFWGAVADVTGRRRTVLVVTGLGATLAILPLFAFSGVWVPVLSRGLYAIFAVGFAPVMLAVVSTRGGEEGRGRALGFFNSARAAGFTGGQLAVGVLLGMLAPRGLYLVIGGISLLSTLVVVFLDDSHAPRPDTQPTVSELLAEVRSRLLPAVGDRDHLRRNGLWMLYVALAFRNATVIGLMGLMPVYLPETLGLTELQMGALLAINPAGQTVFMLLFGRVADAWGRKPLIVVGIASSGAFALVAAAATLFAGPARLVVVGASFVVIAAAFSAMTTGALAFIGDVAPDDRESELMGLRSTAKGVGGVGGPVIIGGLATLVGYPTAFAAGSVLAFLAAGLAGWKLVESREGVVMPGARPTLADD